MSPSLLSNSLTEYFFCTKSRHIYIGFYPNRSFQCIHKWRYAQHIYWHLRFSVCFSLIWNVSLFIISLFCWAKIKKSPLIRNKAWWNHYTCSTLFIEAFSYICLNSIYSMLFRACIRIWNTKNIKIKTCKIFKASSFVSLLHCSIMYQKSSAPFAESIFYCSLSLFFRS